jgi:DNA-binding MarR family transcriptional regulator
MAPHKHELKIASFEDGTCAVLRADPAKPRLLEVIATFYDLAHARNYVRSGNTPSVAHRQERSTPKQAAKAKPKQTSAKAAQAPAVKAKQVATAKAAQAPVQPRQAPAAKPKPASAAKPKPSPVAKLASKAQPKDAGLSEGQMALLKALRSMMDRKHRVEVRGAELAKAASVPQGSVHSLLGSLEKKHLIRTERQGSAQLRAIYEVLDTSGKSARSINSVANGKAAPAAAIAH